MPYAVKFYAYIFAANVLAFVNKQGGYYMFRHSTAWFFSVLIVALIFSLSLAGVAAAQTNTSLGTGALRATPRAATTPPSDSDALFSNTTGSNNTATGVNALFSNTTGDNNTASGVNALV